MDSGMRQANERASEPTRTERADEAARERACRGVRGAKPLGVIMLKSWISAVCLVGSVMVAAQTDKPPDPKELAVVQGIRARIEEHTRKAATSKPAPYSVTIPE